MTAGRLYPGGSWLLNSRQGYLVPQTGNATCWLKFGAMCIPQHGYKMQMKVVASNGYGSNSDSTQETTLIFQTANTTEGASGSSVCAAVHSFIEGSTKHECGAPHCFIVHEVNSSFYEFFGRFGSYTGAGSYYTVDHGPTSGWIACNSFVDPDSCTGSCLVSVPNRGTIFCTSSSTTCICGTAVPQGDICMNNGSRGYKLGTDTAGSGSRAYLALDSDGSDGIGAGTDYFFVANDGSDTKFYNEGPEHIRLCSSSCVVFCKPIQTCVIKNYGATPYMCVCNGCCLIGGIQFRDCQGCVRGYVYHDGTSNFGLLNCAGTWSLKIVGDQSGTIYSCHTHCFMKNIGLYGGSASRVCIGGNRAIEGNSGILSLGEDFTSVCLRATCTITGGKLTVAGTCAVGVLNAIQDGGTACYALNLVNSLNGGGTSIMFNDNPASTQRGYLRHFHADSCDASGAGNSFHFDSTEDSTTVRIDQTAGASGFYIGSSKMLNACVHGSVLCATSCVTGNVIETSGSIVRWCYPSNCGPYLQTGGTYSAPSLALKRHDGDSSNSTFVAGKVCGTTCLATNVISSSGSAPSDYGALAIEGNKGGYGGVHFCGTTFMSASDCGGGGIYNDSCNQWVLYFGSGSSTYLYQAGAARFRTLANGSRTCSSAGYIDICPTGTWGHFITDRSKFYVNKPWIVNTGCIGSYDEDLILHRGCANSTAAERITITSGTTHICQFTKVHGNLCVTGTVCADGMEGDTLSCATMCTGTICFNTSCVTGYDAVYDVYVSANPNCAGSGSYRDIVHMSVYVTTGWSGSAVTKYINHVNNFVRGTVHDSGGGTITAVPKLLVGTTGCECYAAACATCLQIQVAGGSYKNNTCVKIKRVF